MNTGIFQHNYRERMRRALTVRLRARRSLAVGVFCARCCAAWAVVGAAAPRAPRPVRFKATAGARHLLALARPDSCSRRCAIRTCTRSAWWSTWTRPWCTALSNPSTTPTSSYPSRSMARCIRFTFSRGLMSTSFSRGWASSTSAFCLLRV